MYELNLTLEQYNLLMSLCGILCGFLLSMFLFLVLSKF
ncbi:hypothetical protein HMPREF1139_1479 [Campylobacter sp. FOBRC14]|nr:hypothetical protein HMPREF1139_1479 [Campylobacter sp. FOBRC14]